MLTHSYYCNLAVKYRRQNSPLFPPNPSQPTHQFCVETNQSLHSLSQ